MSEEDFEEKKNTPKMKLKKFGIDTMLEAKKLGYLAEFLITRKDHSAIEFKYWLIQNKDQKKIVAFFDSKNKDLTFKNIENFNLVFGKT